jgi:hypothetical protein
MAQQSMSVDTRLQRRHMKRTTVAIVLLTIAVIARAQTEQIISVGNQYVKAAVIPTSGQFQILRADNAVLSWASPGQWNSHTVFYLNATGNDVYYTNQSRKQSDNSFAGTESILKLPDSCFIIGDTIRTVWSNLRNFRVVQELYPVLMGASGKIVIRYGVEAISATGSNTFKGIMLLLDLAVKLPDPSDPCQRDDDQPIVLTSMRYDAHPSTNSCWDGLAHRYTIDTTGIPQWFIAARRFPDYGPPNSLVGHGVLVGRGVTTPDEFCVGDWGRNTTGMKNVTWNFHDLFPLPPNAPDYGDAAASYKWKMNVITQGPMRYVSTMYGPNDHQADFVICPDSLTTLVSLSPHDHYRKSDGSWDSLTTRVDVYVVNMDHQERSTKSDTVTMIMSGAPNLRRPSSLKQLALIPSGNANIAPQQLGHTWWTLSLDTNAARGKREFVDTLLFQVTTQNNPLLNSTCVTPVTIHFHGTLPNNDFTPPAIHHLSSLPKSAIWSVVDNAAGDTGIDSVITVTNINYQAFVGTPTHCSPGDSVSVVLRVIDTTKTARFVLRTVDCAGNRSSDSVAFTPLSALDDGVFPHMVILTIYPNPLAAGVVARCVGIADRDALHIFNAIGTDVTRSVTLKEDGYSIELDCSLLPSGIYVVLARRHGSVGRAALQVVR